MAGEVPTISGRGGSACSLFGIDPSLPGEEASDPVHSDVGRSKCSNHCPGKPHHPPGKWAEGPETKRPPATRVGLRRSLPGGELLEFQPELQVRRAEGEIHPNESYAFCVPRRC